jgi:ribosomal protein L40E
MVAHCHRCSATLDDDAGFCPRCAAPQLRVAPPETEEETAAPGPTHTFAHDRRAIDWQNVIRLALWIAIPVGLVAPFFFPLVVAGPIVLISLYRRRRPHGPLDGKTGFRIGSLLGLLAAYVSAFGLAGWQLVERYSLHQSALLDQSYAQIMNQYAETTRKMVQGNSLTLQQARMLMDFFGSSDGRVLWTVINGVVVASGIVLFAGLGGMLGARLSRRSAAQ